MYQKKSCACSIVCNYHGLCPRANKMAKVFQHTNKLCCSVHIDELSNGLCSSSHWYYINCKGWVFQFGHRNKPNGFFVSVQMIYMTDENRIGWIICKTVIHIDDGRNELFFCWFLVKTNLDYLWLLPIFGWIAIQWKREEKITD